MTEKMYRQINGKRVEMTKEQVQRFKETQAKHAVEIAERVAKETKQAKRKAFQEEADPLFFKAQRGEATLEEWQAKVDEINERFT